MAAAGGLRLYSYYRSSAAWRVRIALNLKGLAWECVPVNLRPGEDEQFAAGYRRVNPAALVPVLDEAGTVLPQSLAIIEYLEERWPEPPLLPRAAADRARVRALALAIACEIHPLDNLRVLKYLREVLGAGEGAVRAWYRHWVEEGLAPVEAMLAGDPRTGRFCHGDAPTLADCCLVPQLFNARRHGCRLDHVPTVRRIDEACLELEAFRRAAPDAQPDAS